MIHTLNPKDPHYQEGRRMAIEMKLDHLLAEAKAAAEARKQVHAGGSPPKKRDCVGRGKPRGRRGGRRKASATDTAESTLSSRVGGSRIKKCSFCQGILFCAQKICSHCKKQQPLKQRLQKRLTAFDEKREEWVKKQKKNHNMASIKDEAIVMLEKLHAIGYKPVLFLGKNTKKKEIKCEIVTPRCRLTAHAKEHLQQMGSFYEYLCEGWNQDSTGNAGEVSMNDEEVVTLHLTPCDPPEDANNLEEAHIQAQEVGEARTTQVEDARTSLVEEVRTMQVEEAKSSLAEEGRTSLVEEGRTMQVEEAKSSLAEEGRTSLVEEGRTMQVEEAKSSLAEEARTMQVEEAKTSLAEEARTTQVEDVRTSLAEEEEVRTTQVEDVRTSLAEEEEARTTQVDDIEIPKGEIDPHSNSEGHVEQVCNKTNKDVNTGSTKRRDFVGSPTKTETDASRCKPEKKRPKMKCSYHSSLETFPIRSIKEERVRKGKEEILVDWEPCAVCGEEWDLSWEPKDALQINTP